MGKHRKSNLYRLLHFWIGTGLGVFWRVEVNGRKNLPWGKPFIVMPNHENALVDAVMMITRMRDQPYSIARAGAFQIPFVAKMLAHIRMFPIYRPQDGISNMSKNEQIMQDIMDCMKDGQRILIYPEGDQSMDRRLRRLKKGTFRMAMMALNQTDGDLDLHMVPAGIVYEDHAKMGRRCIVNFGEPINAREIWEENDRHEARTIKKLIAVMHDRMRLHMMDIPSNDYNETIDHLREMYVPEALIKAKISPKNYTERWGYDQAFANTFVAQEGERKEEFDQLKGKLKKFEEAVAGMKLRQGVFSRKTWPVSELLAELLLFIIALPMFLIGFTINIIPYKFGQWATHKVFKSKNFEGTGLFFFGLLGHTVWWTIWALIIGIAGVWWMGLYFYPFALITGYFAFLYSQRFRKWWAKWRFRFCRVRNEERVDELVRTRAEIIAVAETVWTPESR